MLLGTLGTPMLGNILAGKRVIRAAKGIVRAGKGVRGYSNMDCLDKNS